MAKKQRKNPPRQTRGKKELKKKSSIGSNFPQLLSFIVGVLFLITFALLVFKPTSPARQLKKKLVEDPNNQNLHLELIQNLINQGEIEAAEQALLITQKKFSLNGELEKFWQEKALHNPQELKNLISAWESFVKQKPDYRDGYLKLAFFYHQLGEKQKALENLKKAKLLDPNYPGIKKMETLIK